MLKRKRSGFDDAMSVVTRFVNACNRHDADGVYACLHPDFDSIQPMYPSRNFRGADQVRRNWQAIFNAEPGFRLTVLRAAAADDTVWLELHGAGRDAEVAGVFVMGVQGDRIRWARIYSALVEPLPEGAAAPAASPPLREVSRPDQSSGPPAAGDGEVVEEALIAPVVDIERSGRRRRRSSRHGDDEQPTAAPPAEDAVEAPPEAAVAEPEAAVPAGVAADAESAAAPVSPPPEPEPEPAAAEARVEPDADVAPTPEPEVVADLVAPETAPADEAEPAAPEPPSDDPPRRRFGKKSR